MKVLLTKLVLSWVSLALDLVPKITLTIQSQESQEELLMLYSWQVLRKDKRLKLPLRWKHSGKLQPILNSTKTGLVESQEVSFSRVVFITVLLLKTFWMLNSRMFKLRESLM